MNDSTLTDRNSNCPGCLLKATSPPPRVPMDIGVSGGIFFEAGVACISAVQGCAPQGHSERGRTTRP